jgi:hypothetical protein
MSSLSRMCSILRFMMTLSKLPLRAPCRRCLFILAFLASLSLNCAGSQSQGAQASGPKEPVQGALRETLQQFLDEDASGKRLTEGGWYAMSHFFATPERSPGFRAIAVMQNQTVSHFVEGSDFVKGVVRCSALGQIDTQGRFYAIVAPAFITSAGQLVGRPPEPLIKGPSLLLREYRLVFTDTHLEFEPQSKRFRQVKGPPEWRLKHFEWQPWVNVDTAIQYLEGLTRQSNKEAIRRNARKSIEKLQPYRNKD